MKRISTLVATGILVLGGQGMNASAQSVWQETTSYIEALQDATSDKVCIAMALVDGDEVTQHYAGDCDGKSLFQIGSITKTFTGVLLADAVLDGRVTLSTTIDELVDAPVPEIRGRPITLLDLATHSSGLPRLPDNLRLDQETMADPYVRYGRAELMSFLADHELGRAPEAEVEYSNLAMGLLGFLLADLADSSYGDLVRSTISEPLGMRDTVVEPDDEQLARATAGHTSAGDEVERWGFDSLAGAGALYSTLEDMVRYVQSNLQAPDGVIGDRLAFASEIRRSAEPLGGDIGLAWINWNADGERGVWHNGGTAGHRSFVGFLPGSNRGAIVLASASLTEVDAIGGFLLGAEAALPALATTQGGPFAAYLGNFSLTPAFAIKVSSDGSSLFGQATGQPRFTMTEVIADRYRIEGVDAEIQFNRNDDGTVESLILHQNGVEQKAMKDGMVVEREIVDVSGGVLERYVGQYQLAPGAVMTVTRDGRQLSIQLTGQPAFPVYPTSESRFYYEVVEAEVEFNLNDAGDEVDSLTLYQNGRHQARRLSD